MTETTGDGTFDVAIIGCGTTGLVLMRLLAMQGLRVAAVDPLRVPRGFPRATHLDDETMRAFQTVGLGHLEKSFSLSGVYRHFDSQWRPVVEFAFNNGLTDQNWQSDYMFSQPDFEAVLRGHAHTDSQISHFFGWKAVNIDSSDGGVRVRLRESATGQEREVATSFLVGCDGANSFVRSTMGCTQIDYKAKHRSLIVDVLPFVKKDSIAGRDSFIQAGIRNPLTFVAIAEPLLRFEELLRPEDDTAAYERVDHVYDLLSPWLQPHEYRILRADVYEWEAVIAEPWRTGGVILAGDAAHEMPPHLGQGMACGIRDAMNLAWKLGRVVRGESPQSLLDTYETERKPHMTEFVTLAAQLANQVEGMQPQGVDNPDDVPVVQLVTLRPPLGPGIWADDGSDMHGRLSAQPKLADGHRIDDVADYRFALLATQECIAQLSPEGRSALRTLKAGILTSDSAETDECLKALDAVAVILRPDHYIFGAAQTGVQLDELLCRLVTSLITRTLVQSAT